MDSLVAGIGTEGVWVGRGLPWLRDNVLDGIYFPVVGRGWLVAIQAVWQCGGVENEKWVVVHFGVT